MNERKLSSIFSAVVYLALILSALLCAILNALPVSAAIARICYNVILGSVFLFLLHQAQDKIWHQIPDHKVYLIIFTICVLLIGISSRYPVGVFWMLLLVPSGTVREVEQKLLSFGMLFAVYCAEVFSVQMDPSGIEYYFIVGIAFLILLSMLRKRQELPYVGVILLALSLALQVLLCGFAIDRLWLHRYEVLLELTSLLFLILCTAMQQLFAMTKQDIMTMLLQDDYPLMQELKKHTALYAHCREISRISILAAESIGCDGLLAGAGGMYHEIGRIKSPSDYMKANMELADACGFPQQLKDVIRQHNTGSEKPKSPEAAIVMLSDCILSTGEYLQKNGKRGSISDERLVRNIFANRKEKGSLDEAGLTEEQLQTLKAFYIAQAFSPASRTEET